MSRIVLCPNKMGSESATELAKFFGTKKVFKNRNFRRRGSDTLVNWGNASDIPVFGETYLNKASAVTTSSNKVATFDALDAAEVSIPYYAVDMDAAQQLLSNNDVNKVLCRTLTRASEGRGIVIATTPDEIVSAGLYTGYEPHTNEYRVHIFKGRVIDVAEKRKLSEEKLAERGITLNEDIKSHGNGWVFARGNARLKHTDGEYKSDIVDQSLAAMEAVGLDFGAVDVIYNNPSREAFVLEVNSAPGMEEGSTTLFHYANAFLEDANEDGVNMETFNSLHPDVEDLVEYPLVDEFLNYISYE